MGEVDIPVDFRPDFIPDIANEISKSRADKFKSVIIDDNDFYNKTSFQSDAMRRVQEQAFLAADHSFPVLINGELGTEKTVIAKLIHENDTSRTGKFIPLCAEGHSFEIEQKLFGERRSLVQTGPLYEGDQISFFGKRWAGLFTRGYRLPQFFRSVFTFRENL